MHPQEGTTRRRQAVATILPPKLTRGMKRDRNLVRDSTVELGINHVVLQIPIARHLTLFSMKSANVVAVVEFKAVVVIHNLVAMITNTQVVRPQTVRCVGSAAMLV